MMHVTHRSTRVIDADVLGITHIIELFSTALVSTTRHDPFSLADKDVGGVCGTSDVVADKR